MSNERKNYRQSPEDSLREPNILGKIPPQALDLEEAVLGVLMLEKDRFYEVNRILPIVECFYKNAHQDIYEAILALHRISMPVDMLTVTEELRKSGKLEAVGGAYYLTKLTMNVSSGAHCETHSFIIAEKWMKRRQIQVAANMLKDAYDDGVDVFDSLDECMMALQAITDNNAESLSKPIEDVYQEELLSLEEARNAGVEIIGASTGIQKLDEIINGAQKGKIIILAARPAMGKTALGLQIAEALAADTERCDAVAYFSMEVKDRQLVRRTMSRVNQVFMGNISKPARLTDLEFDKLIQGAQKLPKKRMFINHQSSLTWLQLRNEVRRLVFQFGVTHVVIDYLQLMSGDKSGFKGNREQEISTISRELKKMAMDFDICVIPLSQLSRAVESRSDPTPKLSDLRESGSIEQDADSVLFLYGPTEADIAQHPDMAGERSLYCAKNRDGDVGTIDLRWNGGMQTFTEVQLHNFQPKQEPDRPFAGIPHNPIGGSKLFMQNGLNDDQPF